MTVEIVRESGSRMRTNALSPAQPFSPFAEIRTEDPASRVGLSVGSFPQYQAKGTVRLVMYPFWSQASAVVAGVTVVVAVA